MARDTTTNTPDGGAAPKKGRIRQIREVYSMTRKEDPKLPLVLAAWGVGALVVFVGLGFLLGSPVFYGIFGIPVAVLAMMIVFGRRAQRAAYASIKGQPGAAASVLDTLRRGWDVTPGVRFNRQQDMIHRVLGRPGIILVGEGNPNRLKTLFTEERRHLTRLFGPDVPLVAEDIIAGDEEGMVPLGRLNRTVMRLKPAAGKSYLRPAQVLAFQNRLKAVGPNMPIPKGPMPRNGKMPRGQIR
ncbi:DUF4191 domain-containing protein [Catenulispora subtropica]|uniref:DUF4191 domain-containing protein n=1 Tax=Catenulispora subtropica TaxID=450798 RepID=A0ABN2T9C0_9ACTN